MVGGSNGALDDFEDSEDAEDQQEANIDES